MGNLPQDFISKAIKAKLEFRDVGQIVTQGLAGMLAQAAFNARADFLERLNLYIVASNDHKVKLLAVDNQSGIDGYLIEDVIAALRDDILEGLTDSDGNFSGDDEEARARAVRDQLMQLAKEIDSRLSAEARNG